MTTMTTTMTMTMTMLQAQHALVWQQLGEQQGGLRPGCCRSLHGDVQGRTAVSVLADPKQTDVSMVDCLIRIVPCSS
jgi:hypothetical protein